MIAQNEGSVKRARKTDAPRGTKPAGRPNARGWGWVGDARPPRADDILTHAREDARATLGPQGAFPKGRQAVNR